MAADGKSGGYVLKVIAMTQLSLVELAQMAPDVVIVLGSHSARKPHCDTI